MARAAERRDGPRQLSLFEPSRPTEQEVLGRFDEVNRRHFEGRLPRPSVRFSTRMLRAGMVFLDRRELVLSVPYHERHGWGEELTGTLKHEMVHMWLDSLGEPPGHTREFGRLCRQMGAPRYCQPYGRPDRYVYRCPRGHEFRARRKLTGHSCARCSKRYDPRFRLRIVRRLRSRGGAQTV